jgi:hypothetical protein
VTTEPFADRKREKNENEKKKSESESVFGKFPHKKSEKRNEITA